jgi:hypothetical protein
MNINQVALVDALTLLRIIAEFCCMKPGNAVSCFMERSTL